MSAYRHSPSQRYIVLSASSTQKYIYQTAPLLMAARPYSLFVVLSLLVLLAVSNVAESYAAKRLRPSECKPRCTYRCSATSHKKPCMFFCQKCCAKCRCVPPGVYGNKQVCPCYNSWKTQQGSPKCP